VETGYLTCPSGLPISANDEPEKLLILPPMDDDLTDKIIILKFAKHGCRCLLLLVPREVHFGMPWLTSYPTIYSICLIARWPSELASDRYGVTHYHHPEIMEQLYPLTPEFRLLELFRTADIMEIQPISAGIG